MFGDRFDFALTGPNVVVQDRWSLMGVVSRQVSLYINSILCQPSGLWNYRVVHKLPVVLFCHIPCANILKKNCGRIIFPVPVRILISVWWQLVQLTGTYWLQPNKVQDLFKQQILNGFNGWLILLSWAVCTNVIFYEGGRGQTVINYDWWWIYLHLLGCWLNI